jgi:threonine/homoserine/homoserine lactone efflux protein
VSDLVLLSVDTIWLFTLASIALGVAPGPDNIFVLAQSSQHGVKAGLLVTLGLCTGLIFHTALVVFGVALIFQTSILAFTLLKVVGACYLIYLAWQAFRAGSSQGLSREVSGGSLYLRGIIMNVTNPKVAIFFLAFLPQFVDPSLGQVSLQVVQLGGIFIVATWMVFSGVAVTAGALGRWLQSSARAQLWLNRIAGMVFLALALRLLVTEKQ